MRKDKTTRLIIVEKIEKIQENCGLTVRCRVRINGIAVEGVKLTREGGKSYLSIPEYERPYGKDSIERVPIVRLTINQRNKIRQLLIDAFLKVQEGRSDEM